MHGAGGRKFGGWQLSIEVQDNGCGVGDAPRMGVGLNSMRERAQELGGTLTFRAMPRAAPVCRRSYLCPAKRERNHWKNHGHSGVEIGGEQTDEAPMATRSRPDRR